MIQSFSPQGTVNIFFHAKRETPNAQWLPHCVIDLNHISIRYDKFAYPLQNVRGRLEGIGKKWAYRDLAGTNDTGIVTATGESRPTASGIELALQITAKKITLDDMFRSEGVGIGDFNKDGNPRSFRLGAFADKPVWNPENKDVPEPQRPLVPAKSNPFSKDKWTHVAFTWKKFNTGKKDGVASLYLNGKNEGSITGWNQQFSWSGKPHRILIGLYYMGLFDDLACFNRALTDKEIKRLHAHPVSVAKLLK